MKVTVRLFATFRDLLPQRGVPSSLGVDVDEHETVEGLITGLSLPDELPRIVLVNGRFTAEDSHLHEGDIVSVFPPLIGGMAAGLPSVSTGRSISLLRAGLPERGEMVRSVSSAGSIRDTLAQTRARDLSMEETGRG